MIAGDPNTALNSPHSIVIDESAARRYFNSTDVRPHAGDRYEQCTPKDHRGHPGHARTVPFSFQLHSSPPRSVPFNNPSDNDWISNSYYTYILVQPGTTRAEVQKDVDEVVKQKIGPALQAIYSTLRAPTSQKGVIISCAPSSPSLTCTSIPISLGELEANSNIQFVYIFSVIAVLILLIACVNFMNLSTARSANRAKEVGIRKVAGSTKGHLIIQFLTESILLSFFALVLALCIAVLLLPMFNQLAGKSLHPDALFSGRSCPSSSCWCCWLAVSQAATPPSTFPPFSRFMY